MNKCKICNIEFDGHGNAKCCSEACKKIRHANKKSSYKVDNKHKIKIYNKHWAVQNKTYRDGYNKQWVAQNRERLNNMNNMYQKERRKVDIEYRLTRQLRGRLNQAVKNNYKSGSAIHDLGCSILQFKTYLESQFQDNMTWDNYGKWHIDHIKPLSKFNLSNREELLQACHYTNLQLLWAIDNLKKSNKSV